MVCSHKRAIALANGVVGSEPASPFLRAVLEHASDEIRAGVRV
jgi:hypothetical protein